MNSNDRWKQSAGRVRIGVLSDTHGHLHPEVAEHFADVDHIIHAGDIGDADILSALGAVAETTAVYGNIDPFDLRERLPAEASGDVHGIRFLVAHTHAAITGSHPDLAGEGYDLVVSGHTHQAYVDWHDGVLYLNPGSAGPRRFGKPSSIALVEVDSMGLDPRIIELG